MGGHLRWIFLIICDGFKDMAFLICGVSGCEARIKEDRGVSWRCALKVRYTVERQGQLL